MWYLFYFLLGYFLKPVIDVMAKIFKNAWIEYKNN